MKGGTKDQLKPIILHPTDDLIHTHPILNIHKQICSFIIQLFCFLREVRERLILSLHWEASILFFFRFFLLFVLFIDLFLIEVKIIVPMIRIHFRPE